MKVKCKIGLWFFLCFSGLFLCLSKSANAQFHQNLSFRALNSNVIDCGNMSPVFEGVSAYSVEVRVKFNSFAPWATVFCKRTSDSARDIVLQSYSTPNMLGLAVSTGYAYTTTTFTTGVWYHLAIVYNGTNPDDSSRLKLFVDGNQEALTFLSTIPSVPAISPVVPGSRFCIGAEYNGTTPINSSSFFIVPFDGTIDELRIWNTAISQSSIIAGMNSELTLPQAGLAAYYQFNQGVGCGVNSSQTTLTDLTGNYNGTLWNFLLNGTASNFTTVVDTSVSVSGSQLTANASPASFQWLNCNTQSTVAGQTGNNFSPATSGSYSVIVTQDLCVDTSSCYPVTISGLVDAERTNAFKVYPNPARNIIKVLNAPGETIEVIDSYGRLLTNVRNPLKGNSIMEIDISDFPAGAYILKSGNRSLPFIKEAE